MPNIWTHILFGQEILQRTGMEHWLKGETRSLFHLGCQGPDPLFYHHFLPWQWDKRMNELGERMHEDHCGDFLISMFRSLQGSGDGERALVYACGFLLHHVLDRNAHPYIFARSGFKRWNHQRFEIILDSIAASRLAGITTWRMPVWKELWLAGGMPAEVVRMLDALAAEYYPDAYEGLTPAHWHDCYRQMITALKLFHDPYGVKRVITAGKIEPFVYKRRVAALDYCNDSRGAWRDPVDREWVRSTSFWDHWDDALEEGIRLFRLAVAAAQDQGTSIRLGDSASLLELQQGLGNVSYSTGRACGQYTIQYEDPII